MRLVLVVALPILLLTTLVLGSRALAGPPADERLVGVTVSLAGFTLPPGEDGAADLEVTVVVHSARAIPECLVFALDQPFASRLMRVVHPSDGCLRPTAGRTEATLRFDRLTDDDRAFPGHTLVWGISGGRCGVILPLVGVCAVDAGGSIGLELPRPSDLPSFPSLGSFPVSATFDLDATP